MSDFTKLVGEIEGVVDVVFGPNLDFEEKSQEYNDGLIVTFRDRAAHLEYEAHPQHIRLGRNLVKMCQGGYKGIMVYDLDVEP